MKITVKIYDLSCQEEELTRNIMSRGRRFLTFSVRRNTLVYLYCQEKGVIILEVSRGRSDLTCSVQEEGGTKLVAS